MNQNELNQLMIDSANNAVETSQQEFSIQLDFSQASLVHIDTIITGFLERFENQALEPKAVFTICNILGAYIGETFKKIAGGEWLYDDTNPDAPSVYLAHNNHTYAFAGICYEKLVNDSGIDINRYALDALGDSKLQ